LCRFYAADVRRESFEVFDRCKRKVVVTANPTVMVDAFVKDYLGGDKVLGTEIEVNPKTKKATGFVKKPGVLVGDLILPHTFSNKPRSVLLNLFFFIFRFHFQL
jgi:glycerol-3-phosphate acyltransferase